MSIDRRIISDTHYAKTCLNGISATLDEEIRTKYHYILVKYAKKISFLRGILFWWIGRIYKLIITAVHHPGWSVLVILQSLFNNKQNIILLEFIFGRPTILYKRIIYSLWLKFIIRPSLRQY